jgi:hypothetical protein
MAVRLSPVEIGQIAAKAEQAGLPTSAFVRASALGKKVIVRESTTPDFTTRHELRRIGVNLNQIAHALNAGTYARTHELGQLIDKLDQLFDKWLSHDPARRQSR